VATSSVAYWRNWKVIVLSTVGLAHEMGDALQILAGRPVFRSMKASVREPLEAARKKWRKHPVLSKFRNQASFHLGDPDVYARGLDIAGSGRFVFSESDNCDDARAEVGFQLSIDLVLDGLDLQDDSMVIDVLGGLGGVPNSG